MYPLNRQRPRVASSGKTEGRFLEPSQLKLQATGNVVMEKNRDVVRPAVDFRLTKETGIVKVAAAELLSSPFLASNGIRRRHSGETHSQGAHERDGFLPYWLGNEDADSKKSRSNSASMNSTSGIPLPDDKVMIAESFSAQGVPIIYRTLEEKAANPDRLNLDRRRFTVCPILDGEEQLRLLNCQHNLIRKISNLQSLKRLIFLDLYDNQIEEISGLNALRSLRVLMLGKNRIKKIENLDSLDKLDVLDLHGNEIPLIENLSHLTELRVLNLAGNQITFVDNVSGMLSLAELNLRRNRIRSLADVDKLPSLQRLFLSCNELISFDDITCLSKCISLQEVSLDGNPLCSEQYYKQTVLRYMQQLKQLDMKRITDEEKRIASVMARKEEDRRKELQKISLMKEKRRQAINTAKQQWEMMQATMMGKSNRLTRVPEIFANHVGSYPSYEAAELSEDHDIDQQILSNSIDRIDAANNRDFSVRPASAVSGDAAADSRMRSLERSTSKQRSLSESRPADLSTEKPAVESQDRGNGLAELDADTLTCYGPGALDSLDRNFGIQAAGAVTKIIFKFIEFGDIVAKAFTKIRSKFPSAHTYHFTANNMCGLEQLNALAQLRRVESLTIDEQGNPVTQLSMWRLYTIFRLAHFCIKSLNGVEVTSAEIMTAERTFGVLTQMVDPDLPNYRLVCAFSEPRRKQLLSEDKSRRLVDGSPEPRGFGIEAISRAVLMYATQDSKKQKIQDEKLKKKLAHSFVSTICNQAVVGDQKTGKLSQVWSRTFSEMVHKLCTDMQNSSVYMKGCMDDFLSCDQVT